MLNVKNLTYQFPDEGPKLVFPDFALKKGDHALILGPSGSGKTTYLHLISGLLRPSSGTVEIEGTHLETLSPSRLDKFRGAHVGFVFQKPHLIQSLTVRENIRLAAFLAKKTVANSEIDGVLKNLQIEHISNRLAHQVSQGQAQRVAIARSVINRPDVIYGDEPTASLDDETCHAVMTLLKEQAESCNATLIIATHDQRVKNEIQNRLSL